MQYEAIRSGNVAVCFFVGLHKNKEVNFHQWKEALAYGEIQLMPFVEYYSLLTLKMVAICILGMDSQGNAYYINLLSGQTELDHEFTTESLKQRSQYAPISSELESTTKKPRGGNFTVDEDMLLISAWLNISLDPVKENQQKGKTYWQRVWEYFHEHKTCDSDRTHISLMNCWSTIQLATNKFCGCFAQIMRKNQSGTIEKDKTEILPAKYIMKMDDDAFVRKDEVLFCLKGKVSNGLLYGLISFESSPHRDKDNKWYISTEEWPPASYPLWAHGPGYVVSKDIARFIVQGHRKGELQLFKLEDVAVGIWIEEFKKHGHEVQYISDERFHNAGCESNYVLARYEIPRKVLCLWEKLQNDRKPECCEDNSDV